MSDYGAATAQLIATTFESGAEQVATLMRHSARTFHPDIHDLENRLTDEGRALAADLGRNLPTGLHVRGYASPPHRCVETSELVLAAYAEQGGSVGRTRPVEGLGPFYVLDQQKMWKGMSAQGGLVPYLQSWFDGQLPDDSVMPPLLAARMVLRVLANKLGEQGGGVSKRLDLCVSHDLTVHLVRDRLLNQSVHMAPVEFLDALVLFRKEGQLWLASHYDQPQPVDEHLL